MKMKKNYRFCKFYISANNRRSEQLFLTVSEVLHVIFCFCLTVPIVINIRFKQNVLFFWIEREILNPIVLSVPDKCSSLSPGKKIIK